MTATVWDYETMEPKGWYMTEKYDGIRVYWDGTQCFSRQGTKIKIPASLKNQLPSIALDGELWYKYCFYLALIVKDAVWIASRTCWFNVFKR